MIGKQFGSIFEAVGEDPVTAKSLAIRTQLMLALDQAIRQSGLTQQQLAEKMHTTQPRVSDLKRGKLEKFTTDKLIQMLLYLDRQVEIIVR